MASIDDVALELVAQEQQQTTDDEKPDHDGDTVEGDTAPAAVPDAWSTDRFHGEWRPPRDALQAGYRC